MILDLFLLNNWTRGDVAVPHHAFLWICCNWVMWQCHIMHSMDLVQPELAGIESIQCRAGLVRELVLSGEMSSEIFKLESYVKQHSFPSLPHGASRHELPPHDL